ncbi:MAG: hypothetical protein ACP5IZ_07165 [Thermoprotei archaeon]|jgi:hypothetical protein
MNSKYQDVKVWTTKSGKILIVRFASDKSEAQLSILSPPDGLETLAELSAKWASANTKGNKATAALYHMLFLAIRSKRLSWRDLLTERVSVWTSRTGSVSPLSVKTLAYRGGRGVKAYTIMNMLKHHKNSTQTHTKDNVLLK